MTANLIHTTGELNLVSARYKNVFGKTKKRILCMGITSKFI